MLWKSMTYTAEPPRGGAEVDLVMRGAWRALLQEAYVPVYRVPAHMAPSTVLGPGEPGQAEPCSCPLEANSCPSK